METIQPEEAVIWLQAQESLELPSRIHSRMPAISKNGRSQQSGFKPVVPLGISSRYYTLLEWESVKAKESDKSFT